MCCNKQNMFLYTLQTSIKDTMKGVKRPKHKKTFSQVEDVGQCDKSRQVFTENENGRATLALGVFSPPGTFKLNYLNKMTK